ncbi:U2 small nuclear ribonucleoprotein A' [Amphibalanus amphitrite]|uniref:Probable U2 small nuclear ribonucleoprotein A' n=1 Tax=Amphibalanus amphitrite TaxID=1232801 RepID=A0A6A4WDS7_AMPAM|nr:U2 small nuclear ribonucleoprotein A'-like [Amphibalanus amphitrite]XP_043208737.1 U2 small nuclear ribonucleoprotein A'-like [Amphibalanus amphitrite]XP_043208738.1 U2 small nuclear ribonucleoprotein A'-like [Amphibalanus amphitrite]KAF0305817.1 U2 small nuclear ribonucleoprotein A' [Amphibalanus amphitrite]
MVKLSVELIQQAYQHINPVRDRELDLRAYKIPVIENLGATLDQFDTIDFSENEIRKLDGFPLLKRLKCLMMNNNRIVRIGETLHEQVPNVQTVLLTNNSLQELADLDPLGSLPRLTTLSLIGNPVVMRQHYRLYTIFRMPHLRVLDFRRVKQQEREQADALFKSKKGKQIQKEISKRSKTFVPGGGLEAAVQARGAVPSGPSAEDTRLIKEAIARATSLQEIERLNQILRSGAVPGPDVMEGIRSGQPMEEGF